MTETEEIIRIAAKGDGITESGRHSPFAAPGDLLHIDGTLEHGPHHVDPACRHFGPCGGCQLQHVDDAMLAAFVTDRVVNAAQSQGRGLVADHVLPAHLSPSYSRRRATLHAVNGGGSPLIGFHENGSHRIVGISECPVLAPELFDAVNKLRRLLAQRKGKYAVDIELTLAEQGVACGLKGLSFEGLADAEALLDFARESGFARLTVDEGYGPEVRWEPAPVTVSLGGVSVPLPPGAFLQATADGEEALTSCAREWLDGTKFVADLFSGLGTFAFALAGPAKVLAAEASRDAFLASKAAAASSGRPVHALHRDLFRNPLQLDELNRFGAVVLDPPRAGAREQVKLIADSTVERVVYISCNPSSWARDGALLAEGGYRLTHLRPVGQFRWSTHVELASLFVKG
ncbi:RNA methyltransferase [Erythrobacter sp. SG61-1L]|uniref:class I SAM-dependent RNA methyltransferase n=1 Tax=Erythrobacter sp. SG61-1L TaxID=1603897 RepID=UPI0006C92D6F|nr:class I SAM-dependent RNA methyltransferase [Erythrobacter sp. SG61-1L]KPL67474.1 RNA methyltransferase [Erythrobacter sp. SG61-1L]